MAEWYISFFIFTGKIWLPVLDLKKTTDSTKTTADENLLIEIAEGEGQLENDLTQLRENVLFEGKNNYLKSQRIYNEKFLCEFDMTR